MPVGERVLALLLAVTVTALILAVIHTLWQRGTAGVLTGRVVGYSVMSDEVRIRFEVDKRAVSPLRQARTR